MFKKVLYCTFELTRYRSNLLLLLLYAMCTLQQIYVVHCVSLTISYFFPSKNHLQVICVIYWLLALVE